MGISSECGDIPKMLPDGRALVIAAGNRSIEIFDIGADDLGVQLQNIAADDQLFFAGILAQYVAFKDPGGVKWEFYMA